VRLIAAGIGALLGLGFVAALWQLGLALLTV
jgi:hypothetical protein